METDAPIVRARDLMQRDIITVSPDMPILDVYRLFVEEEIHGAPAVWAAEKLRVAKKVMAATAAIPNPRTNFVFSFFTRLFQMLFFVFYFLL